MSQRAYWFLEEAGQYKCKPREDLVHLHYESVKKNQEQLSKAVGDGSNWSRKIMEMRISEGATKVDSNLSIILKSRLHKLINDTRRSRQKKSNTTEDVFSQVATICTTISFLNRISHTH